ncbi:uncharacterized protein LY89DRAFT_18597 [Mollisia scopiformis]|uniref:Uncharacterized protein n=1 Tax=Mollisia scopiformis TaxID=149040 RepID=A0A194XVH8_MOLSC|nr:uncharacterized protein LY89DRAFT_18597 [Mollisia scopiformis]KUJ24330.1 hypothetical protein LY89DRAFT_18597 [Mollisia scopiformis]
MNSQPRIAPHSSISRLLCQQSNSTPLMFSKRNLSIDNRINLIIGILSVVIGILSAILAWATWRLTDDRRRRCARHHHSPEPELVPLQTLPTPPTQPTGVEIAFRIGRSR